MNRYVFLITSAMGLVWGNCATAATMVDWGGNYVSTSAKLDDPAGNYTVPGVGIWQYNESTRSSPTSGYSAPPGKSGTFYWGGYIERSDGAGNASQRNWSIDDVIENAENDYIRFNKGNSVAGLSISGAAFVAFLSDGFLNYSSSSISFDATSSLSVNISSSTSGTYRFAIEAGGQWYLSETFGATIGMLTLSGEELLNSLWGAWSPTGGANMRLGDVPTEFNVLGSSFEGIQAFGIYAGFNAGPANSFNVQITGFTANAIPEPGSLSLAGLSIGLITMGVLRRQKSNQ